MINNTRRLIKALFLCLSVVCAHAQDIHGNIRQQNDMPLAGMELFLEGTSYKSISDSSGNFRFNNVASGNYLLVTQSPAFEQIKKKITVNAQDIFIKLMAIQKDIQLADVFVEGKQYSSHDIASSYAARLPLRNIENPQTVNTVSQDVIVQQAATDFSSILTNVPGVVKSWSSTNTYYTSRGFITRSYLRNGVASYSQSELDPANTEQFIAIKGPSGTLFGSPLVSFGGAFNRITKKPYDENGLNVSFLGGNMGFSRFTVDANAPLLKDKSLLFRINMAKTDMGSFQDQGLMKSTFVAPSLSYKVNDKLNINFEAEIYSREATSAPQISVTTDIADLKKYYEYKKSYQNNTVTLKDPYTAFYGQINYKISHGWLSQTNITHSKGDNTGNYLTFTLLGDSALARNVTQYPVTYDIVNHIQQNFIGDFNIGHFRNRIVAGLDFYNDNNTSASRRLGVFDTIHLSQAQANYGALTAAAIDAKLGTTAASFSSSRKNIYSAYVSDVFNVLQNLSALASIRIDRYDYSGAYSPSTGLTTGAYKQTSYSPKFGLVYQIVPNRISFFGNYMNGFQNVAGTDFNNVAFKPQYANQWEAGIKAELPTHLLSATVSYYNIKVKNTLIADPDNAGYSIQQGTQFSRGIEADIQSQPLNGFLVIAGYAYNNSKITNSDASTDGLRPVNSGPENVANAWASYQITDGAAQGLGIGLGANYAGKNLIVNTHANGAHYIDGYTLLKGGIFYDKKHFRLSLNMDNIGNVHYFTTGYGTVTPGMLRRFVFGLSVKF